MSRFPSSTRASQNLGSRIPETVGSGMAKFFPITYKGRVVAPHLTVCTATLIRVKAEDKLVGHIVTHRQPIDSKFETSLQAEIKRLQDLFEKQKLTYELISCQTAPGTTSEDRNNCSVVGSHNDLSEILGNFTGLDSIYKMREQGSHESYGVNMMTVDFISTNETVVHEGKKPFIKWILAKLGF